MTVTALSAGNSLVNPTKADIFASEESILHALAFVRHSPVPVPKKNALRDLFLAYAGTADPKEQAEVKAKIIAELEGQAELSSLLPQQKKAAANSAIGMSRPIPSFTAPAAVVAEVIPPAPAPAVPAPEIKPEPAVTAPQEPVPVVPPAPAPEVPAAPVVPPPTEPAPIIPPAPQTTNAKARIDAIKRDINGRVGNPVNLIETDQKVGHEYMSALLDAMKRSSRGDTDLSRLEAAYQAALVVIANPATSTPPAMPAGKAAEPEVIPPPVPPPEPSIPIEVTPEPPALNTPVVTPPPQPLDGPKVGLYHRPIDEVAEEEVSKPTEAGKEKPPVIPESELKMPEEEVKPVAAPPQPAVAKVKVASTEVAQPVIEAKPKPVPIEVKPAPKVVAPPKPTAPTADTKLRPLNETSSALPEQISKLKTAAAAREEAAKKPITDLKAPEIDQGLKLLLAEWVLFKHSGLLRKKPSGIDSPLYKQLAPLPMASVIAGRFEGVTPEIKHTLADYMTGWRYEQGIVHDMGETFENYLRRVVKEILEKQRLSKAAPKSDKMSA
jgi:hypothetical protein